MTEKKEVDYIVKGALPPNDLLKRINKNMVELGFPEAFVAENIIQITTKKVLTEKEEKKFCDHVMEKAEGRYTKVWMVQA